MFKKCLYFLLSLLLLVGCSTKQTKQYTYIAETIPLSRNGISLHLDCTTLKDTTPERQILLIHGVTYSSHEFDINYQDYSLVRFLAQQGYGVWRLDIAGFGQSGNVVDGFMPDSAYAAKDIEAAVNKIVEETHQDKIDLLGWSWGTVTCSLYAGQHSEHLNKLILYAPILSGIGKMEVNEPFHHNSWEHAADDFQRDKDGTINTSIVDPVIVEMWCSSCWHYDGDSSPNGGRRDLCIETSEKLIDLEKITVPTLVICGGNDSYLNYKLIIQSLDHLPASSQLEVINGGAHCVFIEKPYYRDFQKLLIKFLKNQWLQATFFI